MAKYICDIDNMDIVLEEKILEPFVLEKRREMAVGIDKTMSQMVSETRKNAPVDDGKWEKMGFPDHRGKKGHGTFKQAITWKKEDFPRGHRATWYVKSPEYRLAHLLAHGHEHFLFGKPTGKRAKGDPFIHNARDNAAKTLVPNIMKEIGKSR